MSKLAIVCLACASIFGPIAASADVMQNTPPAISVSGATPIPNDLTYQLAHLNGEVTSLQQQVQRIQLQLSYTSQAPSQLYPDSVGG